MPRQGKKTIGIGTVHIGSLQQRISIPQPDKRPLHLRTRSFIKKELVRRNPWWWIEHRRGLKGRTKIGEDPREMRAIPHSIVKGTLPERIVYLWLIKAYFVPDIDFSFQCLSGEHRVLTSDLRWVPIKDLKIGQSLLNFSDNPIPPKNGIDTPRTNRRYFESGVVLSNKPGIENCARIIFSDGSSIVATLDHPWLVLGRRWNGPRSNNITRGECVTWAKTHELEIGSRVPKYFDTWDELKSKEAGYLSGFFDADGNICHKISNSREHGMAVTYGQQYTPELIKLRNTLSELNYEFSDSINNDPRGKAPMHILKILGGRSKALKFLGEILPSKLSHQLDINRLGRIDKIDIVEVINIEMIGPHEIYRLGVSNGTYFAEGFGMHNTSLNGGRLELGGIVADFIFEPRKMILQVQGPTHDQFLRMRKDEEQKLILSTMGYEVVDIDDDTIYNEQAFEDEMRRILNMVPGRGRPVQSPFIWGSGELVIEPFVLDRLYSIAQLIYADTLQLIGENI